MAAKKKKSKLMIEVLTALLPVVFLTMGLLTFLLYRGMMNSFTKAKQEAMVLDLERTYYTMYFDSYAWFWDAVDADPELAQEPLTDEETQAFADYYVSGADISNRNKAWYDSLENPLLKSYYLKTAYNDVTTTAEWEFDKYDYSTLIIFDPHPDKNGNVYVDFHSSQEIYSLCQTTDLDLEDHEVLQKALESNSKDTVYELSFGFPHSGLYYMAYKPIIVDGQIRAILGIGYYWFDFLADVIGLLIELLVFVFWGVGLIFAVFFFLVYFRAIAPIAKIQKSLRDYIVSKNGSALRDRMKGVTSENEIGQLSDDISDLAVAIDNYTSDIVTMTQEKQRVRTELDMAKNIQEGQLPSVFPAFPDRDEFDIYATMNPAKEVGGDFYDFFFIDDDHLALVMADVSGKGVPAALFMMMSKILIHNYAMIGLTPHEVLERTNQSIFENNPEKMFVTVWFGILELSTGKITASNAGHEFPVIRQPDGKFELLKDKHGFVLGALEHKKYKDYELTLEKGGTIFVYTDGVPEATSSDTELFGTDRLVDALNKDPDALPKDLLDTVKKSVDGFVGEADQFDDLTMMAVKLL